ncbi:MAG: phosphate ABC transporter ATP-binding protein [Chloroflexi bacterium]|nr:phosphate ABC transporter ATP-binding protein [Chloroflexota bacterium]|tara:strand:+ start:516 stop:1319 length:804 start_codon:yes stop_codon:yes gene_type:complete
MTNKQSQNNAIKFNDPIIETNNLSVSYGNTLAIENVNFSVPEKKVIALIGPSGCGKSTLIRCINRMNDLIPSAKVSGNVFFHNQNIYDKNTDPTEIRYKIGMVFQKPNPFPKSIYDNVAFGPRVNGLKVDLDEVVETSLKKAALWDEVKDRLNDSGLGISGGQQQRLCIARTLAVNPEIILMDEPASSLDPISTQSIENLIKDISQEVTIIIVTHNMQQAARISDYALVMMSGEERIGRLIEYGENKQVFDNPKDERTEAYVTGRIG